MPRSQHDHSGVREHRESAQQRQHQQHQHHRSSVPSTCAATEQHTPSGMSLETLLQAAYYVEQEEKKRERLASTSSSSSSEQHSFVSAPPHSNHTYASTTRPRGEYHAPFPDDLSTPLHCVVCCMRVEKERRRERGAERERERCTVASRCIALCSVVTRLQARHIRIKCQYFSPLSWYRARENISRTGDVSRSIRRSRFAETSPERYFIVCKY